MGADAVCLDLSLLRGAGSREARSRDFPPCSLPREVRARGGGDDRRPARQRHPPRPVAGLEDDPHPARLRQISVAAGRVRRGRRDGDETNGAAAALPARGRLTKGVAIVAEAMLANFPAAREKPGKKSIRNRTPMRCGADNTIQIRGLRTRNQANRRQISAAWQGSKTWF